MFDEIQRRTFGVERPGRGAIADEILISADSHVMEPEGLWKREVPAAFRDQAPAFGGGRPDDLVNPAAVDKHLRLAEMAQGNISAEVIFPTWGLRLLSLDDPELERVCVRVYNDWIIDYCAATPDRLIGLAVISCYDIDRRSPSCSAAATAACAASRSGRCRPRGCRSRPTTTTACGPPPRSCGCRSTCTSTPGTATTSTRRR